MTPSPPSDRSNRLWTFLLALAGGAALTLCQPPWNQAWLAPFALLPLLLLALRSRAPFRWGWLAGTVHFTSLLWCIHHVITEHGGIDTITAAFLTLLLGAMLGLYVGLFTWWVGRCGARHGGFHALLVAPFLWTATEVLRHFLITGFPWSPLGNSLWRYPTLAAPAQIGGVWLLGLLLAGAGCWTMAALGCWLQGRLWPVWLKLGLPLSLLCFIAPLFMNRKKAATTSLRVRIVQPDITQLQKWDPQFGPMVLQRLHDLATAPSPEGPLDLIVFPESSLPPVEPIRLDQTLTDISAATGAPLLFGSEYVDGADHFYNAAVLLGQASAPLPNSPDALNPAATRFPLPVAGLYAKRHLAPFGEYVPWKKYLFFAKKLTHNIGEFTPGTSPALITLQRREGSSVKLGVLICYESIFADLSAETAAQVAHGGLLINISNDAWYEGTGGKEQLLSMAVMRVIETRVPMIRSSNTGISALITTEGVTLLPDHQPVFQDFTVRIPGAGSLTMAARFGMVLPWIWLGFGMIAAMTGIIGKKTA